MFHNDIPFKVAVGYGVVAIVLILAISLIYSNTKSVVAINQASREYMQKRDAADSTISALLKEEQHNLQQLSDAMNGNGGTNYLRDKVRSLNNGEESIVVHPKMRQTQQAKNTTVEVVKTRKGFFNRLSDAFKKEHAETISVKTDSIHATLDSVTTPVNVAGNVADILEQIDNKEKVTSAHHHKTVNKEMADLQMLNTKLALRSSKQLNEIHQREHKTMQHAINKAITTRQQLLWQIGLLALVTILIAVILVWYIWRDTKKERTYRENLENANEEIRRIMQQRERLLLTITHDIKAPAASISGFIDLMEAYVNHPRGKECLNNIKGSATHLSHLVASLLDYHQLENGLMKIHPVNFSPSQLFQQSVKGMQLKAEEKGLSLSYEIKDNTHPKDAYYHADAFRIRQILDNLVSNAIKYTDQGQVCVTATITRVSNHSNTKYNLTITVEDTGKGIPPQEIKNIFQAFTRLKNAQSIAGAGLGLSITHELVTLLGGRIVVRSEEGKGSVFTVSIPIEEKNDESVDNTIQKDASNSPNRVSSKDQYNSHKILILDDDKLQLQLLQEMLNRVLDESWKVIVCNHVTEALTALHNEQPAIMLMDIEMPEMNGMEIIRHLNHSNMKVIAMTAHDGSIANELKTAGFDDCLFKPFHTEALQAVIGINGNTAEKPSDKKTNTAIPEQFRQLTAFADDDEEAALEIIKNVKLALNEHLQHLQNILDEANNPTTNAADTPNIKSSITQIKQVVHKMLPIATMMQMNSLNQLTALTPENIDKLDDKHIREHLQIIMTDLHNILQDKLEGS